MPRYYSNTKKHKEKFSHKFLRDRSLGEREMDKYYKEEVFGSCEQHVNAKFYDGTKQDSSDAPALIIPQLND